MIRSRLCGVVVALAIGVAGLSACSSSEPAAGPGESTTATSAAPESSAPQTSTAASTEASTDSANGAKPSKDEIVKGYSKIVKSVSAELPDDLVKKVTSCFVDEVYDKASVKTLRAIADGDASKIDSGDANLFVDAQAACQKKLVG